MGNHSVARLMFTWMAALLALLAISTAQAASPERVEPIKSPADSNEYRYLSLENGLEVLLISDPDADKAAAS